MTELKLQQFGDMLQDAYSRFGQRSITLQIPEERITQITADPGSATLREVVYLIHTMGMRMQLKLINQLGTNPVGTGRREL